MEQKTTMKILGSSEMVSVCGGGSTTTHPHWGPNSRNAFGPGHYRAVHITDDYAVFDMWGEFHVDD